MTISETYRPPAGARPGTLAIPAGSPPPRIYLFEYGADSLTEREIEDPAELEAFEGQRTRDLDRHPGHGGRVRPPADRGDSSASTRSRWKTP